MKVWMMGLALAGLLSSCDRSWAEEDRSSFLKECKGTKLFGFSEEKQAAFCDCQLEVYEKHYSSLEEKSKAEQKEPTEAAIAIQAELMNCMPKAEN